MSPARSNELARARAAMSASATRESAAVRREAAALRRENDRLRARLAALTGGPGGDSMPSESAAAPPSAGAMRCRNCGLTILPLAASCGQDQVLVLAGCCPHCDGRLVPA